MIRLKLGTQKSKKASLALSGGGARGIAHIGVIEELLQRGYEITAITGTSMGALVGGVFASGKLEEFKSWLFTLDKMKVLALIDFTFTSQGLIKGDRLFGHMKEFISDSDIENLPIDFAAVAVDVLNKQEVLFDHGNTFKAVRASVAIPTVFTPVRFDNRILVDGGVLNNIPVNHARRRAGELLVAVNVNADVPVVYPSGIIAAQQKQQSVYRKKIKEFKNHLKRNNPAGKQVNLGYFDLINRTINLMTENIAKNNLEKYPPDLLIEISVDTCGIFDFYKAEELVEVGRYSAVRALGLT